MPIYQIAAGIFVLLCILIFAITEPLGLTPLHMYGMTSHSTESLHWALAIVASVHLIKN